MPKLVGMLRVKNGMFFLKSWLEGISPLVDEIVVVDNGSTDGSLEVLTRHPKVVAIAQTESLHEGRDINLAYYMARQRNPDWVIWLDVDEVFESRLTPKKLYKLMSSRTITRYFFRRLHFVDWEHFDASPFWLWYSSWPDRVMWKEQKTGYFENARFGFGLIRGIKGWAFPTHFRIKHLGSVNKQLLGEKIQFYRSVDPALEKTYQRIQHGKPIKWKWREYSESPNLITAQNILMDVIFAIEYSCHILSTIVKKIVKLSR